MHVVRATTRATHSFSDGGRRSAVSPWNVDPLRSTTLRGIRNARSGLRQRGFRSSALHRKSCHASVSVMLGKRGGRCRTDRPIRVLSRQMRHTIAAIKAAWCRSLLSACVRLCQLREVHHSLQQAPNPWSRTQSAATDGSPACWTSSLMFRVCVMLRVLPSQPSVRSLLVLLLYNQRCLSCLACPVWGTIGRCRGVLPRTNARCAVGQ